jgi:hypothetical protein
MSRFRVEYAITEFQHVDVERHYCHKILYNLRPINILSIHREDRFVEALRLIS